MKQWKSWNENEALKMQTCGKRRNKNGGMKIGELKSKQIKIEGEKRGMSTIKNIEMEMQECK